MHGCIYLDSSQGHNESHQIIQLSETSAPPKALPHNVSSTGTGRNIHSETHPPPTQENVYRIQLDKLVNGQPKSLSHIVLDVENRLTNLKQDRRHDGPNQYHSRVGKSKTRCIPAISAMKKEHEIPITAIKRWERDI